MTPTTAPAAGVSDEARIAAIARVEFGEPRGYLAASSMGLPPRRALEAIRADLDIWSSASCSPDRFDAVVERARAAYARIAGAPVGSVAIGSQTSVLVSLFAQAAPSGAEVVVPEGDFSSVVFPFLVRGDLRVRSVPLAGLAEAIGPATWLVCWSFAQSATGELADDAGIRAAAAEHGALTVCDLTQAAGVHPVDATRYDASICHAYKWLCAPRGAAFLTVSERVLREIPPAQAGWYAGERVWESTYGPAMRLAADARCFDVSPAWQAWVGAAPALELFAELPADALWSHAAALGDALCRGLGVQEQHRAIVTWSDPEGEQVARLCAAGIRVALCAGRARAAFHLWNDESDVDAALRALAA